MHSVSDTAPITQPTELLERHRDWWARRGMLVGRVSHTALGSLWLPLADGGVATNDLDVEPAMLDLDRLAGAPLEAGPLELQGDIIRTEAPYPRVPWVEAILGCQVHATIQSGSMRARATLGSIESWRRRATLLNRDWLEALTRLTGLQVQRSGGRYAVAQTLMRGPSDLAEAILGPEGMCLAMYDQPDALRTFLEDVTQTFLRILEAQLALIPAIAGGYVNPFGIWSPGPVVRTQCDASACLSPAQYERWFWPYDVDICQHVGYSVIHLHSGSLHTVSVLLQGEWPQAIQVTLDPEPSGPPLVELVPTFRRILQRKALIVDGPLCDAEVARLQSQLPHDGLCILARQERW